MSTRYLSNCRCRHEIRDAQRRANEIADAHERLQPWAFLYMVTRSGGAEVPMYLATRQDAERFCADDRTKGVGRGGPWMFMFTSAATYLFNPLGHTSLDDLSKKGRTDDGRFAPLAAELALRLYGPDEFRGVLDPLIEPRATVTPDDTDLLDLLEGAS